RVLMMLRGIAADRFLEDIGDYEWTQLPNNDGPKSLRDRNSGLMMPPDIDSARVAGYLDSRKDAMGALSDDDIQQLWIAFYSHYQSPKARLDIRMLGEQPHQFEAAPLPLNSVGLLDFAFGVLWGLESISENSVKISPVFPPDTLHYWAITGINCGAFCCDLVWDVPDSVDHFDDGKEGLQFYINRKYVRSSNQLEELVYNMGTGKSDKCR
ncbi:hypothetical protein KAH55_08110, partial [bacterium]|nr:hypothetical protein [bacterium]